MLKGTQQLETPTLPRNLSFDTSKLVIFRYSTNPSGPDGCYGKWDDITRCTCLAALAYLTCSGFYRLPYLGRLAKLRPGNRITNKENPVDYLSSRTPWALQPGLGVLGVNITIRLLQYRTRTGEILAPTGGRLLGTRGHMLHSRCCLIT